MPPKKKQKNINTDKTQPTLFTLLNKDRASEPVSETQDSQAQDNSQSDGGCRKVMLDRFWSVWLKNVSAEVEESQR